MDSVLKKVTCLTSQEFAHIRKSLGMSKVRLAKVFGVSRQTIQNWESGRTKIPSLVRYALAYLQEHYQSINTSRTPPLVP